MIHITTATLSGAMVAATWMILSPLPLSQAEHVAAGFVVGVLVYTLIAIASET